MVQTFKQLSISDKGKGTPYFFNDGHKYEG